MNINNRSNSLSITLTRNQLWCLASFFAPGLIFGIDDAAEGLTEVERSQMQKEAFRALSEEGLLEGVGTNEIRMDEMLGGMVYSCVHSKDLLVLKTSQGAEQCFYHFLPEWQLALSKGDENYELMLLKDREQIFPHILSQTGTALFGKSEGKGFSIRSRELEMAVFLYDSGKKKEAVQIFEEGQGEKPKAKEFLEGYVDSRCHLLFDMLYDRNDEKLIHTMHHELLHTSDSLYWITYDEAGEEAFPLAHLTSVDANIAEDRFNRMLPAE